ncbi:hypothetical protein N2599_23285 (plasmid) [Rhizobium sullae]|uniref:Uncharacterized protein n=1 Tax=Rhizobium sullae TaxID=50338 RepID=A0ABY5XVA7_RHISU|nr:hypothetical protein [Rhizobium sullae]UWU18196.1 hypothetical protein N2599_23285 [Rhizobium sullae]
MKSITGKRPRFGPAGGCLSDAGTHADCRDRIPLVKLRHSSYEGLREVEDNNAAIYEIE